jgi:two-component system invasion response regulator UvrY
MISLLGRLHVIIVDDHIMVAEGIRDLLKGHVASAGVVASGEDLLSSLATFVPDVILMDIGMPKLNGLDTLDALKRAGCEAGVIMLTMHREPVVARRALDAGAMGYVSKSSSVDDLLCALSAALQGKVFISSGIIEAMDG